jgi:hypothetical protein
MCEICSNTGFVTCVDCEQKNAFCSCNPHFIACSNLEKSTKSVCTELSAFFATLGAAIAAGQPHCYSSRDCMMHSMDCHAPCFYGCKEQEIDNYDDCLAHTSCCARCDSLLSQLQNEEKE